MAPKRKYLFANGFLEAIDHGKCYNHNSHADDGCQNGQANDKPGKRFLLIKGDPLCDEGRNVHNKKLIQPIKRMTLAFLNSETNTNKLMAYHQFDCKHGYANLCFGF